MKIIRICDVPVKRIEFLFMPTIAHTMFETASQCTSVVENLPDTVSYMEKLLAWPMCDIYAMADFVMMGKNSFEVNYFEEMSENMATAPKT